MLQRKKSVTDGNSQYIWDRRNKRRLQPLVYGEETVKAVHASWLGRLIYRLILAQPVVSRLLELRDYTSWSRKKIPGFIERYHLDLDSFVLPIERFRTFNDFFIRELRSDCLSFAPGVDVLCSPCEAQLELVRCAKARDSFTVKGVTFSLERLIGDAELAQRFHGADLCSFYLAPQYYHRFHFPVDCEWRQHYVRGNRLFAVNDFSFQYGFRPFDVNVRHVNVLWHSCCGEFIYIEFGATLVGRIHQCSPLPKTTGTSTSRQAKKGKQKGFFSLGGSSVLMVFAENKVEFSRDILEKNHEGLPVWVRPGEKIGKLI